MTQTLLLNKLGLEILTDTGWETFDGLVNKGIMHTITVTLSGSAAVKLTPDHNIYLSSLEKIPADQLKIGDKVCTFSGIQSVVNVEENCLEPVYDIVNSGPNKRFFANNILCSNCEFIIAEETLINPNTLIQLEGIEPIHRLGQVRWYKKPTKGNIYAVALDPAIGTGGDHAAIEIYEANTTTQIGEWRHNKTDIPNQIKILSQITKYISECTEEPDSIYYSVENNSCGEAALVSLSDYGESNVIGVFLSEPGKKRKGFTTTNKTKLTACAKFKTLVESKKLTIASKALISELKAFVASGASYSAKIGDTDDLIMASLLIVRICQTLADYHVNLDSHIRDHDEIVAPFPFYAVLG